MSFPKPKFLTEILRNVLLIGSAWQKEGRGKNSTRQRQKHNPLQIKRSNRHHCTARRLLGTPLTARRSHSSDGCRELSDTSAPAQFGRVIGYP